MRVKVRGEWIDAADEAVVVELKAGELAQINGIPRETGDDRPRKYGQFPDAWSPDQMREWMEG